MIQTHLMKLDQPYPVLNIDGMIVRHVATLIEVHPTIDQKTGEDCIRTVSHPVVDYGDNHYSGIVYDEKDLEDCEVLTSPLSAIDFHLMVHNTQQMFNPAVISQKPEHIVKRLAKFGIDVKFPKKQDADGYDTDEDADVVRVALSLGEAENGRWYAESSLDEFCFDAKNFESKKALFTYIRDMRSSYYKAFSNRKFSIVFFNNLPEKQALLDELNENPFL